MKNNLTSCCRSRTQIGTCNNTIRRNTVVSAFQFIHSSDRNLTGFFSFYQCSHCFQISAEPENLRFFRTIIKMCYTFCKNCCQYCLLSSSHTRFRKHNILPFNLTHSPSRPDAFSRTSAPSALSAIRWRSIGLFPIVHPPGYPILHFLFLASTAPARMIEERILPV